MRFGVPETAAWEAAAPLVTAEMMGIATHGLSRVVDYTTRIAAGGIDAKAVPQVEALAPALVRVDGQDALGPLTATRALQAGVIAARAAGVAAVFVRRGTHVGALAPYLLDAAGQGFACVFTCNTAPMIAPAGARTAMVGNMPLGIGLPGGGGGPLILDMAMTVVSRSRIRAAAEAGHDIPEGWAMGPDGTPTTDPVAGLKGLIAPIGGEKGARLALSLDLFSGLLSGARFMDDIPDTHRTPEKAPGVGYAILLIDADRLLGKAALAARMQTAQDKLANARAVDPESAPRLPGARALAALRTARAEGFQPDPETLAKLTALATG